MVSKQIEVSNDLFWKLEKERVKHRLDTLEDLLWILIGQSRLGKRASQQPLDHISPSNKLISPVSSSSKEKPYIERYRKMLENPNSLPSKIRQYIDNEGEVTYKVLKRTCVNQFGCKSEKSGSIGASIFVLNLNRYIKIDGRGDGKRLISLNTFNEVSDVIDMVLKQIEVSNDLFWKLEEERVKHRLDTLEDLLRKLIDQPPLRKKIKREWNPPGDITTRKRTTAAEKRRKVIELMAKGDKHTKAFKKVANELNIKVNSVSAACTTDLGINTKEFKAIVSDPERRKKLWDK